MARVDLDCDPVNRMLYDLLGFLLKDHGSIGVVLKNPKDQTISVPLSENLNNESDLSLSTAINRSNTDIILCACLNPEDDVEETAIKDNVRRLEEKIETNIDIHFVNDFQVELIVTGENIVIDQGKLTREGFRETNENNICLNPYSGPENLIQQEVLDP